MQNSTTAPEVPVLLQTKRNTCQMLNCGMTKLNELIAEGVIETVRLGDRDMPTTASIYRVANAKPE